MAYTKKAYVRKEGVGAVERATKQTQNTIPANIKKIITVLVVLLILSMGGLVARLIYLNYFAEQQTTAVVPDNLIGETMKGEENAEDTGSMGDEKQSITHATTIALYKGNPSDNEKFEIHNMLPGDVETKYFQVKVSHSKSVMLYFDAVVTQQTKALGNVLHIKITHLETNRVLYDGTFNDMNVEGYGEKLSQTADDETTAYYKIEVSLPTSVGNEYQAAMLKADFRWHVKEADNLNAPQTGDYSASLLWFAFALSSVLLFVTIIFLRIRHRERRDEYGET